MTVSIGTPFRKSARLHDVEQIVNALMHNNLSKSRTPYSVISIQLSTIFTTIIIATIKEVKREKFSKHVPMCAKTNKSALLSGLF